MTIRRRIPDCKVVITTGAVTRQPAYGTVCKTEFVKNLELERGSWFSLHYKDFPRTVSTMYGGPVKSFVHNDFLELVRIVKCIETQKSSWRRRYRLAARRWR